MTTEKTPCAFCKEREADERSEEGFCGKCHFDIFDVNLYDDSPSWNYVTQGNPNTYQTQEDLDNRPRDRSIEAEQ